MPWQPRLHPLLPPLLLLLLLLLRPSACQEEGEGEAGSGAEVAPHFLHDLLSHNVSVQLGSTAHLHCRVAGINDQSVSWYRRTGDEIQLITFDFQTYHNDDRFALNFEQPNDWRLRIRFVQRRDEGSYQCQVSTHPPLIRTVHLQVVEASIQILDERGVELREKFYREGSTMELQCLVADVPSATALQLAWYHHQHRLNYDDPRGGVSLKTELRGSVARSWLRVSQAGRRDSGIYYCNVTNLAAASVTIHVVPASAASHL
ncbi:cell adhesion molecule 4-like isoform X2 [Eriocheir sinensis]|uniref:cell adhesion molecule 4-like isoform X2 n=1 Tax=Eriocheir sinensis TaxID=95602 RepID=UPI0021CA0955|nr:cell adhesion molecule 4-like isoform X2 [Eriocheir sinensis]